MMKVLIVGKHSYIGNCLEKYLTQLSHLGDTYEVDKISASNGDWKEIDYSAFDVVILLSGLVHKKESSYGYEAYYKVNYEMAVEIGRKAKAAGVKQMIFASTMAVYGDNVTEINKDTVPNPTTFYGKTKLLAEETLMQMSEQQFIVSIVRPPMVYGKDCKGNFTRLNGLVRKLFFFPKLTNRRSMIYIENLCEFIRLIIGKKESYIYHPQNEQYISTSNMVCEIAKAQHHKILLLPGFHWIIKIAMRYVRSLQKLFGDCYYDQEISKYSDMDYWIVDEEESIKRSVE